LEKTVYDIPEITRQISFLLALLEEVYEKVKKHSRNEILGLESCI
jgi:hypothetical protein